jgi:hypothetical protein
MNYIKNRRFGASFRLIDEVDKGTKEKRTVRDNFKNEGNRC